MKFSIVFLLATTLLQTDRSSLTVKDAHDSPTGRVSRLTPSQEDALKVLALDEGAYGQVVGRADPPKITRFIEMYELFEEEAIENTVMDNKETFDRAVAYVPCEIAWHLRIIEFGETIQCLERSASWKVTSKIGDQMLVNFFADKYVFELIQLLKTTDVGDKELFLSIQKMLSSEGLHIGVSPAFFLQHALALHREAPTSPERQEMIKSFLSLHLSEIATLIDGKRMLKALYTELVQDVPTFFTGSLPEHAIAVVATHMKNDEYNIVIINSGYGLENHESTTEIQPKGFHTGAFYDDVPTDKSIEATSFNPLLQMERVTKAQLASAHYHSGTMDQVYYDVLENASSHVVKEPLMPWEWTERQGIGTCTATSVWFALRFYQHALGYENDIRLSMLDQAICDLEELQDTVEDLERQMSADYQNAWKAFKSKRKGKKDHFHYDHDRAKTLAKDRAEKSHRLKCTIVSVALNEILQSVIVWWHELSDINASLLIKSKDDRLIKTVPYKKMVQRRTVLAKAIPQTMASFHAFWALQEEKLLKRQGEIAGSTLSSVLDTWHSIREDVRTIYNAAIRATKIMPGFATALKKAPIVKQTFKSIDVASLDEHSSLGKILDYITDFDDSLALHSAVNEHLKAHKKNANAAMYLIMLNACLAKNVPLLDHLVVAQELPLLYTIDAAVRSKNVSMHWDLKTKGSIAALAAHRFVKYGQPLDTFPELFKMSRKETQDIVDKFRDAHNDIAPIINAEAPSQDDVDGAFKVLLNQRRIAAIAYILPRASKEAISDVFLETKNVRILRLLIDLVQDQKLLEQKIEASLTSVNVVELLLPLHLRYQRQEIERRIIEKHRFGSDIYGEPAEVSLPDQWFKAAYAKSAVKAMELLAPFTKKSVIGDLLLAAAKDGDAEETLMLAEHATDSAVFAAIEEANKQSHTDLAKALFDDFARKKPAEAAVLKAVEQGSVDELEDRILSVSADTIGYALFKAAETGQMDCFEKLVPHSTDKAIDVALSALSDENLAHPSVLRAVNNASRFAAYGVIERAEKASNAELLARMLPFMPIAEVNLLFKATCKNAKSFEITKLLLQFADSGSVGVCLGTAIGGKMEDNVAILLPHVKRERLLEISQSLEFKELGDNTRQAAAARIKSFPTEVAIELAFLPKDDERTRDALQAELEKCNVELRKADLACSSQESCLDLMKSMDSSALAFPIEQAIERLLLKEGDSAALEKLLSFATPYACTQIVSFSSEHGSEEATKVCAAKALRTEASSTVRISCTEREFTLMKPLIPFVLPSDVIAVLRLDSSRKVNTKRVKALLADLPRDLADDALRIAIRGDERKREKSISYLVPKASQVAIDEVYLFAKRIEFDDEQLEMAASDTAKAQGREIERGAK